MSPARALQGYPFFLSPVGEAHPKSKCPNTRAVSAAPKGAHFIFICKYPGFHIGLCPHSTLGYAGVSCLKALVISLNFDALALTDKQGKRNKYDVLVSVSTRKYFCKYT